MNTTINTKRLRRINSSPFMFGLERLFFRKQDLFYDHENLYVEEKSGMRSFPLSCISLVGRTYNMLTGRNQWEIDLRADSKFYSFRFFANWTLYNNNFPKFLAIMKRIKPEAVKSKLNIWGI